MKRTKKGFTLAELLVVVAIIAVLVAIAIPVFTASQDKAEEAVEVANARAAYAQGMTMVASGETVPEAGKAFSYGGVTYTFTYTAGEDGAEGTWTVTPSGTNYTAYNTNYTNADTGKDFSEVTVDGTHNN